MYCGFECALGFLILMLTVHCISDISCSYINRKSKQFIILPISRSYFQGPYYHTLSHLMKGKNTKLQGLASAIIKLWAKSHIAKIAIKRGILCTNNEVMSSELKASYDYFSVTLGIKNHECLKTLCMHRVSNEPSFGL